MICIFFYIYRQVRAPHLYRAGRTCSHTGPIPKDLSSFYKYRTFLYKKILSGHVRVLDCSLFLPSLLNNVRLQVHVSKLEVSAKSGFCTEGTEHSKHALRRFCQHFFKSLFKNLAKINVHHSIFILPSFQFRREEASVPKA